MKWILYLSLVGNLASIHSSYQHVMTSWMFPRPSYIVLLMMLFAVFTHSSWRRWNKSILFACIMPHFQGIQCVHIRFPITWAALLPLCMAFGMVCYYYILWGSYIFRALTFLILRLWCLTAPQVLYLSCTRYVWCYDHQIYNLHFVYCPDDWKGRL